MRFQDTVHARTAQSMRGGKIADILITRPAKIKTHITQRELNQKVMAAFFAMGGEDLRPETQQ